MASELGEVKCLRADKFFTAMVCSKLISDLVQCLEKTETRSKIFAADNRKTGQPYGHINQGKFTQAARAQGQSSEKVKIPENRRSCKNRLTGKNI